LGPEEGDKGFDERIVRLNDGTYLFAVSHIHSLQGRTVIIRLGYDLAPLRARMSQFFLLLFISIPLALILAAIAGQAIARRALRPLEQMTARAEHITASNLSERLDVANERDELGNMARSSTIYWNDWSRHFDNFSASPPMLPMNCGHPWPRFAPSAKSHLKSLATLKPTAKLSATSLRSPVASIKQ
jgi:hypothetical protein